LNSPHARGEVNLSIGSCIEPLNQSPGVGSPAPGWAVRCETHKHEQTPRASSIKIRIMLLCLSARPSKCALKRRCILLHITQAERLRFSRPDALAPVAMGISACKCRLDARASPRCTSIASMHEHRLDARASPRCTSIASMQVARAEARQAPPRA